MAESDLLTCSHVEADDRPGRCYKCGREMPAVMERDPDFEREVLRNAADVLGLQYVAENVRAFADKRTLPGPILLWPGRDFIREWREEAADGFNYGTWELQRMIADGIDDDHRAAALQEALRHCLLMYAALHKAETG